MRYRFVIALACLAGVLVFHSTPGRAQSAADYDFTEIRDELASAMTDYNTLWNFNGAVVVAVGNEVLLEQGYGFANAEHEIRNTADTPLRIASLSKQFTAAAILMLADNGTIDLDAPVSTYLPQLTADIGDIISLRQILNHASGLVRDVRELDENHQDNDYYELDELIELVNQTELQFEPGEGFSYSNSGYTLAAAIIEQVTGEPFGEAMNALLFSPMGMTSTIHSTVSAVIPGRADPYFLINSQQINGALYDPSSVTGGGSILTTAHDLLRWSDILQGRSPGLPDRVREQWRQTLPEDYTLGWYSYSYEINDPVSVNSLWTETPAEGRILSHSGVGGGFESYVRIYLDHGVSIIVLSNQTPGNSVEIARALASIVLGEERPRRETRAWTDIEATLFENGVDAAIEQRNTLVEAEAFGVPDAEDMLRLVDMLLTSRRLDEGIVAAQFFARAMPEYKYSHGLLGEAYRLSGDYENAIAAFDRALEIDPDDGMIAGWRDQALSAIN